MKELLFNIKNWSRRFWRWLSEIKVFWAAILFPLSVFFLSFYAFQDTKTTKLFGMALEITGVLLSISGLLETRLYLGYPKLRIGLKNWLYKFPSWKGQKTVIAGKAIVNVETNKVRAKRWVKDDPDSALEDRLKAAFKNIEYLFEDLGALEKEVDQIQGRQNKDKKTEEEQRERLREEMWGNLKRLHADSVPVSIVGIVWILLGILLNTMAQELQILANWFGAN